MLYIGSLHVAYGQPIKLGLAVRVSLGAGPFSVSESLDAGA